MKGVLIGADFLRLADGIKFLEINTDTDLFGSDVDFLELNSLFHYLSENSFTKLVLIYKKKHIMQPVISVFQNIADANSITLDSIIIPNNSITIPTITSEPNTFYLRCAYDVTAIVDDTYCRDKSEIIKLLFDSNNEELLPKTYVVNPNDDSVYDSFTSSIDNGEHPNVIVKKILPDFEKSTYPAFYKVESDLQLETIKQSLPGTTLMQEYKFNEDTLDNNRICDVIRTWTILLEDVETTIYIGGHLITNPLPINIDTITYTDTLLDSKFRYIYFSNPNVVVTGVPGYYEVLKIENGVEIPTTINSIQKDDIIKSVRLDGLDTNETLTFKETWSSSLELQNLMEYTTASVVGKISQNYEGWLCNLNYTANDTTSSTILTKGEILLVKDSDSIFRFKSMSELSNDDMLVISNNVTASINSIDEYYYTGSIVVLNTEPDDVFISGTDLNEINVNSIGSLIVHNAKQLW
jgi:hypothetical protein